MWGFIRQYPIVAALIFALGFALMLAVYVLIESARINRRYRKHKRVDLTGKKVR